MHQRILIIRFMHLGTATVRSPTHHVEQPLFFYKIYFGVYHHQFSRLMNLNSVQTSDANPKLLLQLPLRI